MPTQINLALFSPRFRAAFLQINGVLRRHVTPEQFGYSPSISDDAKSDAIQAAVDTNLPVLFGPATEYVYRINRTITPPSSGITRLIGVGSAKADAGTGGGTRIEQTHAGYGFKVLGYEIKGIRFEYVGSADGAYAIGNNDAGSSSGGPILEDVAFRGGFEIGAYFGDEFEHPLGLRYRQVYAQQVRSGAIHLGGPGSASSGESHWTVSDAKVNNTSIGPVLYSHTVEADTPNTSTDTISWSASETPIYGFVVQRSANGTSGWAVVPNFVSSLGANGIFTGTTFQAAKTAGQTWFYRVARMTRGISAHRAKEVYLDIQSEHLFLPIYLRNIRGSLSYYYESREPQTGVASLWAIDSNIVVQRCWSEGGLYGFMNSNSVISAENASITNATVAALANRTNGSYCITQVANLVSNGSAADTARLTNSANEAGFFIANKPGSKVKYPNRAQSHDFVAFSDGVEAALFSFPLGFGATAAFSVPIALRVVAASATQLYHANLVISAVRSGGSAPVVTVSIDTKSNSCTDGVTLLADPTFTTSDASYVVTVRMTVDTTLSSITNIRCWVGDPVVTGDPFAITVA